jgi:hypothetical protein
VSVAAETGAARGGMGNSRGTARGAVGGSSETGREDGVAGTPRASGTRGTAARSGANEARPPSQGGPGELGPRSPGPERGSPGISHGTKTFVNKGNGNAGSTGREDTGTQRAPGGPVIPAPAARSGATGAAPRLPLRGGLGRESGSTGPGNVVSPSSDQQQSGATSDTVKNSASGSLSRDSDRSAGSRNGAETPRSEDARDGSASSLLKKRKRLGNSRNYVNLFKTVKRANDAGIESSYAVPLVYLLRGRMLPSCETISFLWLMWALSGTLLPSCILIVGFSCG